MRVAQVRDEAICIRQWDWSETSQTVSLFCRQTGVIRGIAKGAKRENARFSGGIEVLSRGEVIASVKTQGQLSLLIAWDLLESFPAARASLSAFYAGMTMLDLVHHAVHEHDPHPGLYDALLAALRGLGSAESDRRALLGVLWAVLVETGHQPELRRDVGGSEPLARARSYAFSPRLGGLTPDAGARADVWRVRSETVELLRRLEQGAADGQADGASVDRATRLLGRYFREVFACDPPTLQRWLGTE